MSRITVKGFKYTCDFCKKTETVTEAGDGAGARVQEGWLQTQAMTPGAEYGHACSACVAKMIASPPHHTHEMVNPLPEAKWRKLHDDDAPRCLACGSYDMMKGSEEGVMSCRHCNHVVERKDEPTMTRSCPLCGSVNTHFISIGGDGSGNRPTRAGCKCVDCKHTWE